jgi:drug/metabolite transporter (DMT)-like permease
MTPPTLVALRFSIGALVVLACFPRISVRLSGREWWAGGVTGAFFGLALLPLYRSLESTHSGVAAFLVGTCAVFAPIFEYAALRRLPNRYQAAGLAVAIAGSAALLLPGEVGFDVGSGWALLSAVGFGAWSVAISYYRQRVGALPLGLAQVYTIAIFFGLWAAGLGELTVSSLSPLHWSLLLYLGLIGVGIRFLLQTYAQGYTTATAVEIIFLVEPLGAFVWATVFAGEVATRLQWWGCGLIVVGIMIAQLRTLPEKVDPL